MGSLYHRNTDFNDFILAERKHTETKDFSKLLLHPEETTPSASSFSIRKERVLRAMGMRESMADKYMSDLIEKLIEECKLISKPLAGYSLFEDLHFNPGRSEIIINNVHFDLGKRVASYLKNSSLVAVFVATCGAEVEKLSRRLIAEGQTLEGYIVDLIGSEIAETIANYIHQKIQNDVQVANMTITNRYSPGYCNWPVSDQQKLFSLLEGKTCGIRLTHSSLMIPIKSVSGIVGVGRNVKNVDYKCTLCTDEKCKLRR